MWGLFLDEFRFLLSKINNKIHALTTLATHAPSLSRNPPAPHAHDLGKVNTLYFSILLSVFKFVALFEIFDFILLMKCCS
jgi:hypothetical protein